MINKITKLTFNKIKKEKIYGHIKCNIGSLSFNIMNKDVIGGIIEEWVGKWLLQNKIAHYKIGTTQTFPDLVLGVPSDITKYQYLEIKCFNISNSPSFDLGTIDQNRWHVMFRPMGEHIRLAECMINGRATGDIFDMDTMQFHSRLDNADGKTWKNNF